MVTAEIKDVKIDNIRGSIIVETEYKLDGIIIQIGNTRYDESSGTNEEIIAKAKNDISIHCENLIRRIPENQDYLTTQKLSIQKSLTEPIALAIKGNLVGYTTSKSEAIDSFKGQDIKVTYDKNNSVSSKEIV